MPEVTEVEQQPEVVAEQPEVQTPEQPEVTAEETTAEEQPEGTAEAEVVAEDPYLLKTVVDGQEEVWDLKDEERRKKAVEFLQKGVDYGKKSQAIAEWEKANQQKLQFADQLMSDPNTVKLIVAKQLGYDPNMVLGNIQPPNEAMKEMYPDLYYQQQALYNVAQSQRQAFDGAFSSLINLNAQSTNNAIFEKARITNDLNDSEYETVKNFVVQNFRANPAGMYSDQQIQAAVKATVDRTASEKLKTANRVQQTLKKAASGTSPKVSANIKQEKVSDEVAEARRFKEVAQSISAWKPKA